MINETAYNQNGLALQQLKFLGLNDFKHNTERSVGLRAFRTVTTSDIRPIFHLSRRFIRKQFKSVTHLIDFTAIEPPPIVTGIGNSLALTLHSTPHSHTCALQCWRDLMWYNYSYLSRQLRNRTLSLPKCWHLEYVLGNSRCLLQLHLFKQLRFWSWVK